MNPIEEKLKELKLELPTPKQGVGAYRSSAIFSDNIVYDSEVSSMTMKRLTDDMGYPSIITFLIIFFDLL